MALITLDHITKQYGGNVLALDQVSLAIDAGEWVSIMGPSGSGKTTLLNLIGCLDRPTSGRVLIDGTDIGTLNAKDITRFRREHVGLVFQQFHLIPYLTALENVMIAQYYHSMADEAEARDALMRVGLRDRISHLPRQLSGGEQQRVCIARALINQPRIILADEPTGNLDEKNEDIVLTLFRELHRAGHTIVMVTHDSSVGRLADRLIALEHGRISDFQYFARWTEEDIEMALEFIWLLHEDGKPATRQAVRIPDVVDMDGLLDRLHTRGLTVWADGALALTPEGEGRARDVVRRMRLAETLFRDLFHMSNGAMAANACRFEHALNPEMADQICVFLNHPRVCPHGKPIPPGQCCPAEREESEK
ncbi:MAG: ATP-binding cassette domain-containing protein [Candidatus Latescibacteria bacterium]|nr:ATP-binding cassette domain-containing protein [Candidatus Latescibacterota bacterium]